MDAPPRLKDRLPPSYEELAIGLVFAHVARHAIVEVGTGVSVAEINALEEELGTSFPADYRAFLAQFGALLVQGDPNWGPSEVVVCGRDNLVSMRASMLEMLDHWVRSPGWREAAVPFEKRWPSSTTLEEKRVFFRDRLALDDAHVDVFFDDGNDHWRVAYRWMVPVILVAPIKRPLDRLEALVDQMLYGVDCIGPNTRLYEVNPKHHDVKLTKGTFTSSLMKALGHVIVKA